MDAVNLLPLEYRERKRQRRLAATDNLDGRRTVRIAGAVTVLFVVLLGGLFYYEHSSVTSKQKQLADTQAQISAIASQVQAVQAAQTAISDRLTAAKAVTASRMNWDRALTDLAKVLPSTSYVTSLQITAPTSSAPASPANVAATTTSTPAGLTIAGVSPGTNGVALVMDRLSLLPWLSGVTLQSSTRQLDGTSNFNMTAGVSQER